MNATFDFVGNKNEINNYVSLSMYVRVFLERKYSSSSMFAIIFNLAKIRSKNTIKILNKMKGFEWRKCNREYGELFARARYFIK